MKTILTLLVFLSTITWFPAFGELTDADLNQIRLIIREEVKTEIKAEITASEARMKEYIDLKIANVDSQIKANTREIGAIRSQINVFIGIPLLIITLLFAWRALRDRANDKQIQALIAENEHLKRQQTITS
ncbi:hypothetical protein C6496_01305 [Candidatus Poribacteria bacterium]|nr:MAG: hypothetical protein C6496_01305 [Candidatus Poribacteria bacterium]